MNSYPGKIERGLFSCFVCVIKLTHMATLALPQCIWYSLGRYYKCFVMHD